MSTSSRNELSRNTAFEDESSGWNAEIECGVGMLRFTQGKMTQISEESSPCLKIYKNNYAIVWNWRALGSDLPPWKDRLKEIGLSKRICAGKVENFQQVVALPQDAHEIAPSPEIIVFLAVCSPPINSKTVDLYPAISSSSARTVSVILSASLSLRIPWRNKSCKTPLFWPSCPSIYCNHDRWGVKAEAKNTHVTKIEMGRKNVFFLHSTRSHVRTRVNDFHIEDPWNKSKSHTLESSRSKTHTHDFSHKVHDTQ